MRQDKEWTPGIGLRRGLCVGVIAAVGIGAVIVLCGRYVALPWSLSGPGGYRLWMRVLLIGGAGFGFAWAVVAVSERYGGMTSMIFDSFAVLAAAIVAIGVVWIAISPARLLAGQTATVPGAVLLVVVPTVAGAVIAIVVRRS